MPCEAYSARLAAEDTLNACMMFYCLQFYQEAWAGNLGLMDELIAEEHAQRDMVWQVRNAYGMPAAKQAAREPPW